MEVIQPFAISPHISGWEATIHLTKEENLEYKQMVQRPQVEIHACGLGHHGRLGIGIVAFIGDRVIKTVSMTIGHHQHVDIYFSQLGSLLEALKVAEQILEPLPILKRTLEIIIYTNSQTALKSLHAPRHQSGQALIIRAINKIQRQQEIGINIHIQWLPAHNERRGTQLAKAAATHAIREDGPYFQPYWGDTHLRSSA